VDISLVEVGGIEPPELKTVGKQRSKLLAPQLVVTSMYYPFFVLSDSFLRCLGF